MDPKALIRTFEPYTKDDVVSAASIAEAYNAKDKYGQALPLPPKKLLMTQVDTNGDGAFSTDELKAWKGYEGKAYCRNPGDAMYGCLDRCNGGVDNVDGDPGYFENYVASTEDYPKSVEEVDGRVVISTGARYTGGFSKAQRNLLKYFTKNKKPADGAFVLLGGKDMHQWRIYYDAMTNVSNKETEIHVYDPFTGFPECDHSKDTGMCPPAGSAAPDMSAFKAEIKHFGDESRVQIHKIAGFGKITAADLPTKIAMVMIDVSLYSDVLATLDALHDKLPKGTVVFIHDFGWEGYTGVEKAVKDYTHDKGKGNHVQLAGGPEGVACYLGKMVVH